MELKRPVPTGTTSQAANDLQHEAAMRVQARLDADERFQRRMARAKTIRSVLSTGVLLLALGGGGYWAYRNGWLDSTLDRKEAAASKPAEDVSAPAPEPTARKTPAAKPAKPAPRVASAETSAPAPTAPALDPKRYAAAVKALAGATVDYWKNAVPADRSSKEHPLTFTGLVPDGAGGHVLLELEMEGARMRRGARLEPDGSAAELNVAAFNALVAQTPFLVAREGRAYYCAAGKAAKPADYPVPAKGGVFDPGHAEFGALADCLAAVKTARPALKYQVLLSVRKLGQEFPVAKVAYGETVPRAAFEKAVAAQVGDADVRASLLSAGRVVFKAVK